MAKTIRTNDSIVLKKLARMVAATPDRGDFKYYFIDYRIVQLARKINKRLEVRG